MICFTPEYALCSSVFIFVCVNYKVCGFYFCMWVYFVIVHLFYVSVCFVGVCLDLNQRTIQFFNFYPA